MNRIIESSIRKHNRVSIKVIRRNHPNKVYIDYSVRIQRLFDDLTKDISHNIESCMYDFPEDRVVLSVTALGGPEQLYEIFNIVNK